MNNFNDLGLRDELLRVLTEMGIETPTPIQEKTIPALLEEKQDFIGLAQTGTGKTAAFGLPLVSHIDIEKRHTQAIILTPTRELGQQVAGQLDEFSKYVPGVNCLPVYGGANIQTQISALKQRPIHIIIATPGRLIDLIKRKVVNLSKISFVVLDEADEMLNMGFKDELDEILATTPDHKNTWLFSATMPNEIRNIIKKFMSNPKEVRVSKGENEINQNIDHQFVLIKNSSKKEAVKRFMDADPEMRGIIFTRTKLNAQDLAGQLQKADFRVDALHGDLSQPQRDAAMRKFRDRTAKILVATDVAARGLDVDEITHVIHYNLPDEAENYTHRSGRTARAGKSGFSLALINTREIYKINQIERTVN